MTPPSIEQGLVWYIDYADGIIGRLDPRTAETTEWQNPYGKPGYPGGFQSLTLDSNGNPWGARHEFNGQRHARSEDREIHRLVPACGVRKPANANHFYGRGPERQSVD